MRILMLSISMMLFFHCQDKSAQNISPTPTHEYIELHWFASFGAAPKTITLNCIGDSVWLKMKEVGKEINGLTREKRNWGIGPGGQYDTVYYHKKMKPQDWKQMDSLLTAKNFWSIVPTDSVESIDGFSFGIDAKSGKRCHAVSREDPKGDIYEIGLQMIRLAGLKDEWSLTENQRSNF
mgnify:CR=1 FL=1